MTTRTEGVSGAARVVGIDTGRDLLYRLALVGGLGPRAAPLAELAGEASQGAWTLPWTSSPAVPSARGIDGGSPLELSIRSHRWPGMCFATCIGLPHAPPVERARRGLMACGMLTAGLGEGTSVTHLTTAKLERWLSERVPARGRFGSYVAVSASRTQWKVKLYLDLFAGSRCDQRLDAWAELLEAVGRRPGSLHRLRAFRDLASPSMACIEWDHRNRHGWYLYWRMKPDERCDLRPIAAAFGIEPHACLEVDGIFREASGGYLQRPPITGFVHALSQPHAQLGFYSSGPARRACNHRKRRELQNIWQRYGGRRAALSMVWQLAAASNKRRWVPSLTMIGADICNGRDIALAAYFRPNLSVPRQGGVRGNANGPHLEESRSS